MLIAGELLLLALDPATGAPVNSSRQPLAMTLGGALIAELGLTGGVVADRHRDGRDAGRPGRGAGPERGSGSVRRGDRGRRRDDRGERLILISCRAGHGGHLALETDAEA
ncbi:hypothetical protein CC117_14295 [Parafrankia colletiae]|uniref:Uncharacterized protein n=1 Tax=Parafrankia colletiae TaxID=573497 RepID=A0A1S1R3L8_9ACTN|nr:GPP34 family phosphoprotein [Parafrankia colletiae]MCK9903768.1 GPP34 family phosphoprotein [Frankia sp. Cpl3]OHV40321.1 hypothetical protein CC117_14295 [Parafrankia colletiae]